MQYTQSSYIENLKNISDIHWILFNYLINNKIKLKHYLQNNINSNNVTHQELSLREFFQKSLITNQVNIERININHIIDGFINNIINSNFLIDDFNDFKMHEGIIINSNNNIISFPIVSSTNDVALDIIKNSHTDIFTTVICEKQSKGRGRNGNKWESDFSKNIIMSIAIINTYIKQLIKSNYTLIPLIIGVSIHQVLSRFINNKLTIKWPNDIYKNNYKLAGILVESIINKDKIGLVIGIGINYAMHTSNFTEKEQSWQRLVGNDISKKVLQNKEYSYQINDNNKYPARIEIVNLLIEQIQKNLETSTKHTDFIFNYIRKYHFIKQKQKIELNYNQKIQTAEYIDIDNNGNIIIKNQDQETIVLNFNQARSIKKL